MRVKDADDQVWRITRRWVPWRRRVTGWSDELVAFRNSYGSWALYSPLTVIAFLPQYVAGFLALLEVIALYLLLPLIGLFRIPFGQHWVVEVRRGYRRWYQEESGDWRTSGARIREIRDLFLAEDRPEPNVGRYAPRAPARR